MSDSFVTNCKNFPQRKIHPIPRNTYTSTIVDQEYDQYMNAHYYIESMSEACTYTLGEPIYKGLQDTSRICLERTRR